MLNFWRNRGSSISMVVLVLLVIMVLQGSISYSTNYGRLDSNIDGVKGNLVSGGWLAVRVLIIFVLVVMWALNRKRDLLF